MKTPDKIRIVSNGESYRIETAKEEIVEKEPRIVEEKWFFGFLTRLKLEKWCTGEWSWTTYGTVDWKKWRFSLSYIHIPTTPMEFKTYLKAREFIKKEWGEAGLKSLNASVQDREWKEVYK